MHSNDSGAHLHYLVHRSGRSRVKIELDGCANGALIRAKEFSELRSARNLGVVTHTDRSLVFASPFRSVKNAHEWQLLSPVADPGVFIPRRRHGGNCRRLRSRSGLLSESSRAVPATGKMMAAYFVASRGKIPNVHLFLACRLLRNIWSGDTPEGRVRPALGIGAGSGRMACIVKCCFPSKEILTIRLHQMFRLSFSLSGFRFLEEKCIQPDETDSSDFDAHDFPLLILAQSPFFQKCSLGWVLNLHSFLEMTSVQVSVCRSRSACLSPAGENGLLAANTNMWLAAAGFAIHAQRLNRLISRSWPPPWSSNEGLNSEFHRLVPKENRSSRLKHAACGSAFGYE